MRLPCKARPNVTFAGFVDYADLPGVLREIDVATIPYLDNERGRGCNPLKAYEYLAAGLPDGFHAAAGPGAGAGAFVSGGNRR